jgi:toxin ParE1/3/4
MRYRLTRKAAEDIRNVHRQGMQMFGRLQANNYHLSLMSTFELIAANPYIARERSEISPPVRVHPFGSHLIIYTADSVGNVLVVRVRHQRENWPYETGL